VAYCRQTINMFWGAALKQGHACRPSAQEGQTTILHLSHAWTEGEAVLKVKVEAQDCHLASLSSRKPAETFNLYFDLRKGVEFEAQGSGVVYLAGYFEPLPSKK